MAKKKNKGDQAVTVTRNLILGFIGLVIIALVTYGVLYSSGAADGEFVEGTHYTLLEDPDRQTPDSPTVVTEFFSYACIHCRNFDPLLEEWQATLGDNARFERQPVAFSPVWALLGRTYLTLEALGAREQNHERLFRAIHDQSKQFLTPEMVADFVDGNGVSREEFLRAYNSPKVREQMRQAESMQRRYRISSVPTLVVAGKYLINMDVGRKQSLAVAEHLIALEQQ